MMMLKDLLLVTAGTVAVLAIIVIGMLIGAAFV